MMNALQWSSVLSSIINRQTAFAESQICKAYNSTFKKLAYLRPTLFLYNKFNRMAYMLALLAITLSSCLYETVVEVTYTTGEKEIFIDDNQHAHIPHIDDGCAYVNGVAVACGVKSIQHFKEPIKK
jgi:hypothetical protein